MSKIFLYNVQTTYEIVADDEAEAYGVIQYPVGDSRSTIIDRDVLLVDVTEDKDKQDERV